MIQVLIAAVLFTGLHNPTTVNAASDGSTVADREVRFEQARATVEQQAPINVQPVKGGQQGQHQLAQAVQAVQMDRGDQQALQEALEELAQAVEQAQQALEQNDVEGAQRVLGEARDLFSAAMEPAPQELRQQLEMIDYMIWEAQQKISEDYIEEAREDLEKLPETLRGLLSAEIEDIWEWQDQEAQAEREWRQVFWDQQVAQAEPEEMEQGEQEEVEQAEAQGEQEQPERALPSEPPQPEQQRAYWNTWFERGREVATELKAGSVYSFVLDLAPYDYSEFKPDEAQSVEAAPSLESWLRNFHDMDEVTLTVRPVLLGDSLEFFGKTVEERDITVQVDRLEIQPNKELLEQYARGALPLPQFADAVQAASLEFKVNAVKRGCGIVALSIWHGLTPLDHLVRTIAVGENTGAPPMCGGETEISGRLRGGFASLLNLALDLGPNPSSPPDAALHIFELPDDSNTRSVAVFVDGSNASSTKYRCRSWCRPTGEKPEPAVYTWEMQTPLSGYLATDRRGENRLVVKLEEAREWAIRGVKDAYQEVAQELKIKIFSAEGAGQRQADHALRALQTLAKRPGPVPVVMARVSRARGENLYMPLNLFAAEGVDPVLESPITVVQPLPRERYPRDATCISTWAFGIPTELRGAQGPIALEGGLSELTGKSLPWLRTPWPNNRQLLLDYLAPDCDPEKPAAGCGSLDSPEARPGEGLLLLAHHDTGILYFTESAQRVLLEQIKRVFPIGSVAVLAACATSAPESDNQLILTRLNKNGVDAMVVSPLPIRVDFGTRLAIEFAAVIRDAEAERRTPTLAELFEAAHKRTAEHFREKGSEFDDMALEFVILGDHGLRLCSSTPSN